MFEDLVIYDDNYGFSVQSLPSLPAGWSLSEGVATVAKTATELFGAGMSVINAYDNFRFSQQSRELDLLQRSGQIDLNRVMTGAQVDIAKAQAATAVNRARIQTAVSGADLSTVMGNINARIAGLGSSGSLMLWLTVAGVGIGAMQYFKGRR